MRGAVYDMLIPYDVLVAAVRKALPGIRGWIDKPLGEETLTGCTVFRFSQRELGGDLGEVEVRKLSEDRSQLRTKGPQSLLGRHPTQEEKDALRAIPDEDERLQRERDLWRKIRDERKELRRRRERHFDDVIQAMFGRLYRDSGLILVLQAKGNTSQLEFMAWLAGEKKQVGSGAVGEQLTPAEDEGGKKGDKTIQVKEERQEPRPPEAMGIFFAYAHEDEDLRDELEKHLTDLKRQGVIATWHDRKIGAGKEWEGEIDPHLNTAPAILLLVSPDFIDSDYCMNVEVKRAMERHEDGEARVIPVILRQVHWKSTPFGKLKALPTDGKPVTSWPDRDEAFFDVAQGIRAAVMELRAEDSDSGHNHEKHNQSSAP